MESQKGFDLCYVTTDSIAEGVGSSQIIPLLRLLASSGLSISLVSFEKAPPSSELKNDIESSRIDWKPLDFKGGASLSFISRLNQMRVNIPNCKIIHARSDLPAFAGILSKKAPVLWDVRSLWADQKALVEKNPVKSKLIEQFKVFENFSSANSMGLSTLTHAVVPILESRNRRIPDLRIVVPTAVDLEKFAFSPEIPKPFMGLYSGTYSNYYDMETSELFLRELSKLVPIETHWAKPHESARDKLDAGEDKIFTLRQVEMPSIIAKYSFGISVCRSDSRSTLAAAVPTKIGEFLATGRPVIVNSGLGDMDQYLTEFNAGIILDQSNLNFKNSAIQLIDLLTDPETPYRCRALAEKYFSIRDGAEKYSSLYSKMLD
jgi:hypothetical protein